jgi:hypothetical protein
MYYILIIFDNITHARTRSSPHPTPLKKIYIFSYYLFPNLFQIRKNWVSPRVIGVSHHFYFECKLIMNVKNSQQQKLWGDKKNFCLIYTANYPICLHNSSCLNLLIYQLRLVFYIKIY